MQQRLYLIKKSMLFIFVSYVFLSSSLTANEIKDISFSTSSPIHKEFIGKEKSYSFTIRKYDPRVKVVFSQSENEALYNTPEQAVISHLSAMSTGNYQLFMDAWTKSAQLEIKERDQQRGRSPESKVSQWESVMKYKSAELINRIDYDGYVIITYGLLEVGKDTTDLPAFDAALTRENGQWKLTQDLKSNPVFLYWNDDESARIKGYQVRTTSME